MLHPASRRYIHGTTNSVPDAASPLRSEAGGVARLNRCCSSQPIVAPSTATITVMDRTLKSPRTRHLLGFIYSHCTFTVLCSPYIHLLVSVWMPTKSLNLNSSLRLFVVSEVEDGWGGGCADPISAGGGAAQTDYRDAQGNARPARGPSPRLPQHRHQGLRAPAPLPGLSQGKPLFNGSRNCRCGKH